MRMLKTVVQRGRRKGGDWGWGSLYVARRCPTRTKLETIFSILKLSTEMSVLLLSLAPTHLVVSARLKCAWSPHRNRLDRRRQCLYWVGFLQASCSYERK